MSKKHLLFAEAERLFTIEQTSVDGIAVRLKICEKTVRLWKEEGSWDAKRKAYLSSRQQFHEEMYEFCRALMKSVSEDLKASNPIDPKRLGTIARIIPNIYKVKDYEDAVKKLSGADSGKSKDLVKDMARIINEQLTGETSDEPAAADPTKPQEAPQPGGTVK
ncbi:MAG: hypothetical protein NTX59_08295 [Elusimicrobia bacterium]|nr:hypothetical protein [Elusimicrobiota bacterium]